ncbi:MAG: acyl-CoA dehydratase activase [Pseudomonadota bacterium]
MSYKANTSCAAGTGSFLDQQALRLNLAGSEELSEIAFDNTGQILKIASRCAVFAKTDLIHAQQEGYTLPEISDGLCHGLAKNIVDTLLIGEKPNPPLFFAGGVSRNKAVARHIGSLTGLDIIAPEMSHLYGAIGAALNLADEAEADMETRELAGPSDLIDRTPREKKYYHDPLELRLSEYPDFSGSERYELRTKSGGSWNPVEVDIYEKMGARKSIAVYLGIDIGSISTKAVLLDRKGAVIAGFYTRTAGRPVTAVQAIFKALSDLQRKKRVMLKIVAAGTTGSGRKFVGKIIGADLVIDEITAHARAAYELNPDVDTIIEIGGQDSKFTNLKSGMVTFCIMNNVCAAGTGSFIEEQARKLGCPLSDYSRRTEGRRSPIASDRCTVFMERDMNHCLSEGFAVDEVLASVLHSVRENYLTKVAVEKNIGKTIFFQGATAKNRALVAAFEQRLGKPILVSRYCHLTGAIGTALALREGGIGKTRFRGIDLHKKHIPTSSEVCGLCTNHCKITLAHMGSVTVAYGFLCGRDYDTKKFVSNNTSGFDLLKARKKAFSFGRTKISAEGPTVGIPAALHMLEDMGLWKKFFDLLSIKTVTSERLTDAVKKGKNLAGAEFCAPVTAAHGHARSLADRADYVFFPFYFEQEEEGKSSDIRRQYCYYTQFVPSLVSAFDGKRGKKFLTPLVRYLYGSLHTKVQLHGMIDAITGGGARFLEVSDAWDKAVEHHKSCTDKLRGLMRDELKKSPDVGVVLLGRPYTVLSPAMNNAIPGIFASMGIKTFYQDMLTYGPGDVKEIEPLLEELHWLYASRTLEAAYVTGKHDNLFPVLVTSFKCAPDSFIIDYFKKILDSLGKPYLILQLDEHDSSVGYETRIEAAVRSFRNHLTRDRKPEKDDAGKPPIFVRTEKSVDDKTLLIPNWDPLTCRLIAANLRGDGIDARLLEESEDSIQRSLRQNTGQCIPLNIIAQSFIDTIEKQDLDPAKTALWMLRSTISCNIKLYPYHIKTLLEMHGRGMEKAGVYVGKISHADLSLRTTMNAYFTHMFGGLTRKVACRIRPYERKKGTTDSVIVQGIEIFSDCFLGNLSKEEAVREVTELFAAIETTERNRPKVAVFGDMYARDNDVFNQDLIHFIEDHGGEVITTPYNYYARMISGAYFRKWLNERKFFEVISSKALLMAMESSEKLLYRYFEKILGEPMPEFDEPMEKILTPYNIRTEHTGESLDNILKVYYIKKHHPDVALFVQTNPAFCCPSLITEAMAKEIEKNTGVPVVSITYDGTSGSKNDAIIPYLKYPRNAPVRAAGRGLVAHRSGRA